ncbi:hypothetical protein NLI96_g8767 [Meripilus lineatus]|uniref:Serine protease n=1 Tax=Meripilus lineatus TaxID=2056292 RepID=A0AAD5YDN9_9APHY|nr:hypothetical protein NLI96_g8767 [Physisporinus lineatus]
MGYNDALLSMMYTIGDQYRLIRDWEDVLDQLGEQEKDEDKEITEERKELLGLVEKAKKKIEKTDRFHSEVTQHWTILRERIIGKVVHVEPIAASTKPQQYTKDCAFIELYKDKFDWDTSKGNKVYIATSTHKTAFSKHLVSSKPTNIDVNGKKCLLVIKNGLATGTTIGRASGMESFTSVYTQRGHKKTSIELAVLHYGRRTGPFSAPGDSGSIVLTRDGGILGMITGGAGNTYGTDVTYLTPYWYIEEEIKKVFPDCHLYEVVE